MVNKLIKIALESKVIGVDTMLFIYLFENNKKYFSIIKEFFNLLEKEKIIVVTSIISPIEIISISSIEDYPEKQRLYLSFFKKMKNLKVKEISWELVEKVGYFRRKYNLRTPDAIQLVTAIDSRAQIFITNDTRFKKITEISVLILDEFI